MAEHYIVHQAKGCVYVSQNTCCIICHLTGQDSSSFFTWECGCNQPVIPGIFSTSAGHWTHWTALRPQTSQEQRNPTWTPPARPEDVPMCFLWAGRFWETPHAHTQEAVTIKLAVLQPETKSNSIKAHQTSGMILCCL